MKLLQLALLYAQSASLTVSTFDSHHQPVPSVKLYLQRTGQKETLTGETDSKGSYRFTVPVGGYTIRAESKDKAEAATKLIQVGTAARIELVLQPQFFDEPQFAVAGVTGNTYRGGHGADTVLRSSEDLSKATAALSPRSDDADAHPLETVRQYQHAAGLDPTEMNLFNWGAELLVHRAPPAAIEVFNKGVRRFPHSTRLLLGLAASYYAMGSYDQAAHCFFEASDIRPADPAPYLFLGKVQAKEITASAGYQERLARFARLHPENALASYYHALSLWNQNRSKEAQPLLEKAVALDPHLGIAYVQLGIIHAASHAYPEAIAAYQKAISEDPSLEEAHYRLSEVYRITGDSTQSKRELRTYRQLSKTSAENLERERREIQQFVISLRK